MCVGVVKVSPLVRPSAFGGRGAPSTKLFKIMELRDGATIQDNFLFSIQWLKTTAGENGIKYAVCSLSTAKPLTDGYFVDAAGNKVTAASLNIQPITGGGLVIVFPLAADANQTANENFIKNAKQWCFGVNGSLKKATITDKQGRSKEVLQFVAA